MFDKGLFVWVEGNDDQRLMEVVAKPSFQEVYRYVAIRSYAQMKKSDVNKFLRATPYLPADYIFVGDLDNAQCITQRKAILQQEFPPLDAANIIVVSREIESWYLAGITNEACRSLGIKAPAATDTLSKEEFNQFMPNRFDSRIDWMREILENFSIETARTRNSSFEYFARKYQL
jgi:hypothetical protein